MLLEEERFLCHKPGTTATLETSHGHMAALSSGIYRIVNCQRDVRLTPVTVFPLPSKSTSLKCPEISCLRGYSQLR